MPRFNDSDLNQFRKAIAKGVVIKAICSGIPFAVTAIGKQTAHTAAWKIPLGRIAEFKIDIEASIGF
jgi:hypothetical protein